ncbi:MAG: hypothetical protein ABFE08_19135 [Armatimonadia bacterium]
MSKHAMTYSIAGVVLAAVGALVGGWGLVLLWPAVACLVVGMAYGSGSPALFGKRANGSLNPVMAVVLLPYLGFTYAIWKVKRKISKEPLYNEVAPGLWVGRRVLGEELPEGVKVIVDVTCEFAEPSTALARCEYRALPTLNYGAPEADGLRALVEEFAGREGIYVHCAQGHGRSATVAAALLLRKGLAGTWEEAVAMVVKVRPKVHLEGCQEAFLRGW